MTPNVPPATQQLLTEVFDGMEGFIEVRRLKERGSQRRRPSWYSSVDSLLDDVPNLAQDGRAHGLGVYYGVLPRAQKGRGTAAGVPSGRVLWADLDFHTYAGGEAEARRRLESFSPPASAVVASGHGLHAYWFLQESQPAPVIVKHNKSIADALESDRVHDAPRLLRLPGTFNMKPGD